MVEKDELNYPPNEKEVNDALWGQCWAIFNFYINTEISAEQRRQAIESALFDLKHSNRTQKYSMSELEEISKSTLDKRLQDLYKHESKHAKQVANSLKKIGITQEPEFDVYYCPILADMYQSGGAIGLISMRDLKDISPTREQVMELDRLMAIEMMKSPQNLSWGDAVIILGIISGKVLTFFR